MTMQLVGWALIHSLWQGALIAALLGVILMALRKAPAAWRHVACLIALIAMPVFPLLTSARTLDSYPTSIESAQAPAPRVAAADKDVVAPPQSQMRSSDAPIQRAPHEASKATQTFGIERLFPWLVLAWLLGVFLLSLRVIGGFVRAHKLVHEGTTTVSREINEAAMRIARRLHVRAHARVLASVRAQVPMVIGMFRPIVLIPASLLSGLTLQQVEAILAHELAHVRRYDYAINVVQTIVETLFFFHPAMWWLSRRLRDEREQACDELAVTLCGGDPIFYSRVLLTVEEWRSERISFAPAATGGNLALRIRKLIGEEDRKLDVGPRWFAGVVTVVAVLLAGGGVASDQADAQSLEVLSEAQATQDTMRARPASVARYDGAGGLEEGWKWANNAARSKGYDRYWIGYVVDPGTTNNDWFYLDRSSPVNVGNNSWISGHMRFNGDFKNLKFSGTSLTALLGDYAPRQYAIFLGFDATSRRTRLVRVHVANFVFPMHFNRWPLLWLDQVNSAESIRMIASLEDQAADEKVLSDLPAAVGAHNDLRTAMPILTKWLNDTSAPHEFRAEAIEALAYHNAPEALVALARIARSREAEELRTEAVEALEEIRDPAAADTLIDMAQTLDSENLRAEAIEALGSRSEPKVASWLERIARSGSTRMAHEAIEALAEMPERRGVEVVERLAQARELVVEARIEAVESLSEIHDGGQRTLETLSNIVFNDPNTTVQLKATESIAQVDDRRAVDLLVRIVQTHPLIEVQIEATEALGEVHEHQAAVTALENIARNHPQRTVRIEAMESIGNFPDDASGMNLLIRLLESEKDEEVAMSAMEALAHAGSPRNVVAFIEKYLKGNNPLALKIEALETLADLPDDIGMPLLEVYARSTDRQLRAKAAELVADRYQ